MHEPAPAFATTVRHLAADTTVASALKALGWPMPTASRRLARHKMDGGTSAEIVLVWRNPQELLALCVRSEDVRGNPLDRLTTAFAAGKSATAFAVDTTCALGVLELNGRRLENWLSRLVDAASIPAAGDASGARLGDVPVLLVRPEVETVWLVADRPLLPYMTNWLTYAHEGADVNPA